MSSLALTYGQPLILYYRAPDQAGSGFLTFGSANGSDYSANFVSPSTSSLPVPVTIQSTSGAVGAINPSQPFNLSTTVGNTPYYLGVSGTTLLWTSSPTTTWTIPGKTVLTPNILNSISYNTNGTTSTLTYNPLIFYTIAQYCQANTQFPIAACTVTPAPPAPTTAPPAPTTAPPGPTTAPTTVPPGPTTTPTTAPPGPTSWIERNLLWFILILGVIVILILVFIIWLTHQG